MRILTTLILSASFAGAQIFHDDESFYRYLENRQRMALVEMQARLLAKEHAEQERPKLMPEFDTDFYERGWTVELPRH